MTSRGQIGRYEVLREIGRGGMATVYLARDPRFGRQVAIKVLPRQFTHDPKFLARFEREARTLAALEHPAIVPVYDFGQHEDEPYLVMRHMSGGTLADRIRRQPLSLAGASAILGRIAPALDEAHALGIIHRDLKPVNILFDHNEKAYLADFGIVKLAQETVTFTGTAVIGTPAYMSPEQVQGTKIDGRSDIYSLGGILFEMLTGEPPYEADSPMGLAFKHVNAPIPQIRDRNPDLTQSCQAVIERSMAKKPDDRYSRATELAAAVELLAAAESSAAVAAAPAVAAEPVAETAAAPPAGKIEETVVETPLIAGLPVVQGAASAAVATGAGESDLSHSSSQTSSQPGPAAAMPRRRRPVWAWAAGVVAILLAAAFLAYAAGVLPFGVVPEAEETSPTVTVATKAPPAEETAAPRATAAVVADEPATAAPAQDEPAATAEDEAPAPTAIVEGGYLERALAGEYRGKVVSLMGVVPEDDWRFNESLAAFKEETGIEVEYFGTREFEELIRVRVEDGDPPDIADVPQPGLAADFAARGELVDVSRFIPLADLQANYNQSWLDMATVGGPDGPMMAGVWHRYQPKSLVWYPVDDFEAAGYSTPQTWDELLQLTDRIVAEGGTPWCIGIESGTATGWVVTDWIEDIMLRTAAPEEYDAWVAGDLPFNSPPVRRAVEIMSDIWFNPERVLGGTDAIVSTYFGAAAQPMFEEPPRCWLHRQAAFITSFFPEATRAGVDYDFFYLPPIDPAFGRPWLIAGDMMVMFNDRDEVRAVMEFFSKGESVRAWLADGGALSPHRDSQIDWYGTEAQRRIASLAYRATNFRFDASDLMPGPVGAGSFWQVMTEYVAGAIDLDTALSEIDASWPR